MNKWKLAQTRKINRKRKKNAIRISREELDQAVKNFFSKGGKIIKLTASDDLRPFDLRPFDPTDILKLNLK